MSSSPESGYGVKVEKNVFIPARDGTKLGATLVRPDHEGPFPAIVEIYPYRKDDYTSLALPYMNRAVTTLARSGYVVVRVDIRGTGSSEGFTTDMYEPHEMTDGYDVIEWAARQPWCTGKVGMWGSSYGGVNSLQIAMHNPPHLNCIVPMLGTDEVYLDTFYPGGCLSGIFMFCNYGPGMLALTFSPPDLDVVGERWIEMWRQRLENNSPWLLNWMKNQTDSQYWKEKSLNPDFGRVRCPTFLIGGWFDAYPASALRVFSKLKVPKKVLIGPWTHMRMDEALPGPQVDYVSQCLRWFDHWLRGMDTGILSEPPVTLFVRKYDRPAPRLDVLSGFWRHENEWPPKREEMRSFFLGERGLLSQERSSKDGVDSYDYNPSVGVTSGFWGGLVGNGFGLPLDQRHDEAYSLSYTTDPLEREMEVTGSPEAVLYSSSSADVAYFSVKLCDVAPDGTSVLVSQGILNGTHRNSHVSPSPLVPRDVYELHVTLKPLAYVFEAGHSIRMDVSGSDFPQFWPSPKLCKNEVHWGPSRPSRLILPLAPPQNPKLPAPRLERPSLATPKAPLMGEKPEYTLLHNFADETLTYAIGSSMDLPVDEGTRFKQRRTGKMKVSLKDPGNVTAKANAVVTILKSEYSLEVEVNSITKSSVSSFNIQMQLDARIDGKSYFAKQWSVSVPRRLF